MIDDTCAYASNIHQHNVCLKNAGQTNMFMIPGLHQDADLRQDPYG